MQKNVTLRFISKIYTYCWKLIPFQFTKHWKHAYQMVSANRPHCFVQPYSSPTSSPPHQQHKGYYLNDLLLEISSLASWTSNDEKIYYLSREREDGSTKFKNYVISCFKTKTKLYSTWTSPGYNTFLTTFCLVLGWLWAII